MLRHDIPSIGECVYGGLKVVGGQVGISHDHLDVSPAAQFCYCTQVNALHNQVGSKGVP